MMDETRQMLLRTLREYLTRLGADEEIDMNKGLGEMGLDSMNAINLMLALEGEFEVAFPDSMLNAETFRSAATLESAIQSLRAEASSSR